MRRLGRRSELASVLFFLAIAMLPLVNSQATTAQETVRVYDGGQLRVESSLNAIQRVAVQGNITAARISNASYPARTFTLSTNRTGVYTVNLWLSQQGSYTTTIFIDSPNPQDPVTQLPSYYLSGGDLNLTVLASFEQAPVGPSVTTVGWDSFTGWVSQFGGAFPLWVKVLYAGLGLQFGLVGYRWIRFEDDRRRLEKHLPPLDRGNKAYLWTDIAFRTIITGFTISLALMVGEVLVILLAKNLFLVDLSLAPLADFFSILFAAIIAVSLYFAREGLDRFLDLKPLMED